MDKFVNEEESLALDRGRRRATAFHEFIPMTENNNKNPASIFADMGGQIKQTEMEFQDEKLGEIDDEEEAAENLIKTLSKQTERQTLGLVKLRKKHDEEEADQVMDLPISSVKP